MAVNISLSIINDAEEGSSQQNVLSPQAAPIQGTEANTTDMVTLRRRTVKVAFMVNLVIILALLGGVIITGYRLKEVIDQLNTDVYKDFSDLSRKEGIVPEEVWSWIVAAKADMNLNPHSAHYLLEVSSDGKSLYQASLDSPPRVPTIETYLLCICVSSKNQLNSRVYFELMVTQRVPWTLGLRTESFNADISPDTDPDAGIWTIASAEGKIIINDGNASPTLHVIPAMLGLYLDYARGQVSFYDSVAKRHIHTYLTTFNEKLRFYAAVHVDMQESHGILISFV
ncbi:E3 ubiquitin-protein ligase TRIM39-like isoform X1 [Tachysurus fulvidraco]|uniref:E3 ubiquitin-protein ligase TRIM39-like isoform X1 n=1 Tax=Tachysurus fulvidraco TaxID=1234273 RepID=UPI000F4E3F79|nr:E3 ubiquitin-protein ligase TRIM39-like isoform X1 [Tachysurus fulvidraco]